MEEGQEPLPLPPPTPRHPDQCPLCQDQSPTMTSPDRVPAFFPVRFPTMTSELSTSTQPDQGGIKKTLLTDGPNWQLNDIMTYSSGSYLG